MEQTEAARPVKAICCRYCCKKCVFFLLGYLLLLIFSQDMLKEHNAETGTTLQSGRGKNVRFLVVLTMMVHIHDVQFCHFVIHLLVPTVFMDKLRYSDTDLYAFCRINSRALS